jgi:glyceraldehyde 3-phosphate dehydrogenase
MRVAINGLGRIGRATLKVVLDDDRFELVATNDLIPPDNMAYLLRYDTVYGRFGHTVDHTDGALVIDGKNHKYLSEKDPAQLPWKDLDIDVVFECTGIFDKSEDLEKHLHAGAKNVILSAPTKSPEMKTVVYGVNSDDTADSIVSCASCTTNSITPVVEAVGRRFGIQKAMLTTIHAYTSTQGIVDGPAKKMRRGRAAAANIVPTTTGAAIATTKALPEFEGLFDGVAVRVPVPAGSISDMTFLLKRTTTVEQVNQALTEEAQSERYKGVLAVTEDELTSSDIIGNPHASIVDLSMTKVVDGDLVKIMAWYDNEWGYVNQMVREAAKLGGGS